MALTRVTVNAGADGRLGTADDGRRADEPDDALGRPEPDLWLDRLEAGLHARIHRWARTASRSRPAICWRAQGGCTWADIKAQAAELLGIELTDADVGNIPLLASDEYGKFIPGANGYPQLVVGLGRTASSARPTTFCAKATRPAPVSTAGAVLTGHAFLDDIAHAAVPVVGAGGVLVAG